MRARPRRGSGLTGVLAEANSFGDGAGVRVRKPHRSNPERTDSPTHIRPGLSADHHPLHLAAAVAALDQDRGGGARVGCIAVSPVEQALVGLDILSGVSTPGGRPLQLGVRRDRLAGAAATGARCRTSGRTSDPWWHRERTRQRPLWIGCVGCRRGRCRCPSGDADSAAEGHRSRYPRTSAPVRRLHHSATDRSPHQPAVPASWARAVVERSNDLGVDLIAITGDLIDGTLDARRADIEPLRDLKATDGVYVISGNHEYIFGYSTWMAHFAALGLLSLENRHIVLDRAGSKLVLAGITDRASRRTGHPVRDLAAVLEGAPKHRQSTRLNS